MFPLAFETACTVPMCIKWSKDALIKVQAINFSHFVITTILQWRSTTSGETPPSAGVEQTTCKPTRLSDASRLVMFFAIDSAMLFEMAHTLYRQHISSGTGSMITRNKPCRLLKQINWARLAVSYCNKLMALTQCSFLNLYMAISHEQNGAALTECFSHFPAYYLSV